MYCASTHIKSSYNIVTEKPCYCSFYCCSIAYFGIHYTTYLNMFLLLHVSIWSCWVCLCASLLSYVQVKLLHYICKNIMIWYCWHGRCRGYLLSRLATHWHGMLKWMREYLLFALLLLSLFGSHFIIRAGWANVYVLPIWLWVSSVRHFLKIPIIAVELQ